MQLDEVIRNRINYYLKLNNMKSWQLYRSSGLSKATVYSIMSGRSNLPSIGILLHICEGLGITLTEFFDDPTFADVVYEKTDARLKTKHE